MSKESLEVDDKVVVQNTGTYYDGSQAYIIEVDNSMLPYRIEMEVEGNFFWMGRDQVKKIGKRDVKSKRIMEPEWDE